MISVYLVPFKELKSGQKSGQGLWVIGPFKGRCFDLERPKVRPRLGDTNYVRMGEVIFLFSLHVILYLVIRYRFV